MKQTAGFVNNVFKIGILAIVLGTGKLSAQDYKTGIGLRGGLPSAITLKHFFNGNKAVELIVGSRWAGFSVTGLYEISKSNAFDVDRLDWYYGVGGHVGFYSGRFGPFDEQHTAIGIDGIIGIEYNIEEIPINISLDYKPAINFGTYFYARGDEAALSVRYIF